MVKFAVGENRVYGDVGRRYLLIEKLVNRLHRKLVLRSIEHKVVVFTERRRMRRNYLVDPHNLVDKVAVASLVVPRSDRFGNLPFIKSIDGAVILRLYLVLFEIRRTCVRIRHLSSVSSRGRVLRIETGSHLKADVAVLNLCTETVEGLECLCLVFFGVFRLEKDVPCIEHVALFLQNFDEMETVRSLDYLPE